MAEDFAQAAGQRVQHSQELAEPAAPLGVCPFWTGDIEMAEPQNLERFEFEETDEGYMLTVAAEDGGVLKLAVTPDQMDAIIDALNDVLGGDDEIEEDD
jgi:hypothetical protein